MKLIVLLGAILFGFGVFSQRSFQTGVHVNTSFNLNAHRANTGIWSSESGYGFALGIPVRVFSSDDRYFNTGLDYEYMAFDNWANGQLVASTRFQSVNIPLNFNFNISSNWFWSAGSGFNYLFRTHTFTPGSNVDIKGSVNHFQPYLSLGILSAAPRGAGLFELGAQIRYHFLDVWQKWYPIYSVTSSHIISFDLSMRFFIGQGK